MPVLVPDPEARFACTRCGRCCAAPWAVLLGDAERAAIEALPWSDHPGLPAFERGPGGTWRLPRRGGGCAFLGPDGLCLVHGLGGLEAKPRMCRRFPYQDVVSDEHVWVTANRGCDAVQRGVGPRLAEQEEEIRAVFATELDSARPDAGTRYPVADGVHLPHDAVEAAFEALLAAGGDRLFPLLARVAAFVAVAPAPGEPSPPRRFAAPDEIPLALRHALALTLYADAIDASSFLGRLGGVVALPAMLRFRHAWTSRLTGAAVDMAAVLAHPGHLPPEGEAALVALVRSRFRARQVFWQAPTAAAGATRTLLEVDAVLFLARALAPGRPLATEDVYRAMHAVEFHLARQPFTQALARLDPRLEAAWRDPEVARAAADLFRPAPSSP